MSRMTSAWFLFSMGATSILITTILYGPYRSLMQRMIDSLTSRTAQDNRLAEVPIRWLLTSTGGRITLFIAGAVLIAMTAPVIWG